MCGHTPCHATPGASVFRYLRQGTVIIVKKGFGDPPAEKDTEEAVLQKRMFSALLASGRRVIGYDAPGIHVTGKRRRLTPDQISDKARELYRKANKGREPLTP